ncbi:MAG: hypothetical protein OXQ89_07430 [Rhodospirillaceae bacterium]|nr:hypothetical protein [Rhodospirillaceae bacterium]MDE0360767.1 hypothetical protein [Rhodospirillaceae bacterium]
MTFQRTGIVIASLALALSPDAVAEVLRPSEIFSFIVEGKILSATSHDRILHRAHPLAGSTYIVECDLLASDAYIRPRQGRYFEYSFPNGETALLSCRIRLKLRLVAAAVKALKIATTSDAATLLDQLSPDDIDALRAAAGDETMYQILIDTLLAEYPEYRKSVTGIAERREEISEILDQ